MKKKFVLSLLFIFSFFSLTFSQVPSVDKFFPSAVGNTWVYDTPDSTLKMVITKDSMGIDKSRYIFYNNNLPVYRIDSAGETIYNVSNKLNQVKYILNSDSGDTWIESSNSLKIKARVNGIFSYFILGELRRVKQICYYKFVNGGDSTISDNFNDGNYDGWTVSSGSFAINDSVFNPLSTNQYSLVCKAPGIISIPSNQAYGSWEFDYYKGNDNSRVEVDFIADRIGTEQNQNGYYFTDNSNELIGIVESSIDSTNDVMCTEHGYTSTNGVWYRIKIVRNIYGSFSTYLKGGSFGSDYEPLSIAEGTNPAINNRYISSDYFVLDLDSGDRISNIVCKNDEDLIDSVYVKEVWLVNGIGEYCEFDSHENVDKMLNGCIINGDTIGVVTSVQEKISEIPQSFKLYQNYPNPFNPVTTIGFRIGYFPNGIRGFVSLKVFDLLGREVATLVNEEKPAGVYKITWNAMDLSSGVYFYQLKAGNFTATKKLLLLR